MMNDDLPLSMQAATKGAAALAGLIREDLDPYSVEELKLRIETLETEIKRAADAMVRKKNRLSDAEALFSFKGS